MRISRFYLIFIWIVSLFSTILFMTSMCRDRQPINSEVYMTGNRAFGARMSYLEVNLNRQKDIQYHESIYADAKQYNTPSFAKKRNTSKSASFKASRGNQRNKMLKMCSATKRNLQGRMNISQHVKVEYFRNQQVLANIKYGGTHKPTDCKSRDRVAVIIPYRDRADHLDILVNYLHMMLQRQKLHYGIYVVEMALPIQFNRGLLANAGFMTAQSIGNYTCYIVHDVDLLPINDFNSYTCGNGPKHLVARSSKFEHGQLPYEGYIGGVLALSRKHILKVNGFSNLYFGWGGEDDDMYQRITANNLTLERVAEYIGVYMALPHDDDSSNPTNPYRETLVSQAEMRMKVDGLSSTNYRRKSLEFRQLYTWILIDCVESEIMKNYAHLRINSQFNVNYDKKYKVKTKTIKDTKLQNESILLSM